MWKEWGDDEWKIEEKMKRKGKRKSNKFKIYGKKKSCLRMKRKW